MSDRNGKAEEHRLKDGARERQDLGGFLAETICAEAFETQVFELGRPRPVQFHGNRARNTKPAQQSLTLSGNVSFPSSLLPCLLEGPIPFTGDWVPRRPGLLLKERRLSA